MDYPLFIPPDDLVVSARASWTLSQARSYRDWLLGSLDARVAGLVERAGVAQDDSERYLLQLGRWVADRLPTDDFSELADGRRRLNNHGYALVADIGLACAKELTSRYPQLRWEIVRRAKQDISYNLPVLVGFEHNLRMDPVGGSITEAYALLRGDRDETAWRRAYEHWSRNVRSG